MHASLLSIITKALDDNQNLTVRMLLVYLTSRYNSINSLCKSLCMLIIASILIGFGYIYKVIPDTYAFGAMLGIILVATIVCMFLYNKFEDVIEEDFKKYLICLSNSDKEEDEEDKSDTDIDEDDDDETYDGSRVIAENRPFVE